MGIFPLKVVGIKLKDDRKLKMEIQWEKMGIEKLIRKELLSFGGYSAAASPEVLEGKIEVTPKDIIKIECQRESLRLFAASRIKRWHTIRQFNIYPDDGQEKLRKFLAGYAGR